MFLRTGSAHTPWHQRSGHGRPLAEIFGLRLNMNALQEKLAEAWKEDLVHQQISMQDAAVYERYISPFTSMNQANQ
jgi:hypothetical protein